MSCSSWVSMVPANPVHTGIGWGVTTPGLLLPVVAGWKG
jgi:hypothetical protein